MQVLQTELPALVSKLAMLESKCHQHQYRKSYQMITQHPVPAKHYWFIHLTNLPNWCVGTHTHACYIPFSSNVLQR